MLYYHPSSTVIIDDDIDFLDILKANLKLPNCMLYSSPAEALSSISKINPQDELKTNLLKFSSNTTDDISFSHDNCALYVDIKTLHHKLYTTKRFKEISVLVVDYYMGEVNGLEICEQLTHLPAKKILLTGGQNREKLAIGAFNQGIIDHYINKADINFLTQLKQAISLLEQSYFRQTSNVLEPYLASNCQQLIQHKSYQTLINKIKRNLNACEYYLLDSMGSRIFMDDNGNISWLIIRSENEFLEYEKIARDFDGPFDIVNNLVNRIKMPFFFSENDYDQPIEKWDDYLHNAYPIPGINGYYYSLIDGNIHNNIKTNSITSFSEFSKTIISN